MGRAAYKMQLAPNSVVLVFRFTTQHIWFVPTIMGLKCKLSQSTDRVVEPLVKALSVGIDRRFQAVLSDREHLIACALLPQFKLNFLPEDAWLSVKRLVLNYVQEVAAESHSEVQLMTMIFSALWIQQDNRQQKIVHWRNRWRSGGIHGIKINMLTVSQGVPTVCKSIRKGQLHCPSSAAV